MQRKIKKSKKTKTKIIQKSPKNPKIHKKKSKNCQNRSKNPKL